MAKILYSSSGIMRDTHKSGRLSHLDSDQTCFFLENERDKSIRFDDNLFLVIECDFKTIVILPLGFLHWEQN